MDSLGGRIITIWGKIIHLVNPPTGHIIAIHDTLREAAYIVEYFDLAHVGGGA